MAHIGKLFKLHFRRDLCLGCTNNRAAWPEAWNCSYDVSLSNGAVDIYRVENAIVPRSSEPDDPDMVWLGDEITQHGRTFRTRVRFVGYEQSQRLSKIVFELEHDGIARLSVEPDQSFVERCDGYTAGIFTSSNWIVHDPTFWGHPHANGTLVMVAARWNVFPP